MEKAIVGVMPLWDDSKKSIWMLPGYFDGITKAGGIPIMLPIIVPHRNHSQSFLHIFIIISSFLFLY